MFFVFRMLFALILTGWIWHPCMSRAETIILSAATTTSAEFPEAVAESLARMAKSPGESHRLIIQGSFAPSATVKIHWWGKGDLTVSGMALLDGSQLPHEAETLFMAGRNLTLKKCRFVNSQGHAVIVGGRSDRYAIEGCSFEDCQQSAIHVWNDPHAIRVERHQRGIISGNHIKRFNLKKAKWRNDAITVFDQGVTISRNFISDSPTECNGIRAMGRDNVIERNVIKNVSRDDAGGIYLWGGPHASLFRGNIVRWNHIIGASRGIYLDDGTSGTKVQENVVQGSSFCAIFIGGGRSNMVQRNVIDRAPVFVHIDSRCLGWDSRPDYAGIAGESVRRLREALMDPAGAKILQERYPDLQQITKEGLTMKVCGRPEANLVRENFVRSVERNWELMDFSAAIQTDFRALNKLSEPNVIEQDENLLQVSLRARFGFQAWDRLEQVLSEALPDLPKIVPDHSQ